MSVLAEKNIKFQGLQKQCVQAEEEAKLQTNMVEKLQGKLEAVHGECMSAQERLKSLKIFEAECKIQSDVITKLKDKLSTSWDQFEES